jgi:hypothetical protein
VVGTKTLLMNLAPDMSREAAMPQSVRARARSEGERRKLYIKLRTESGV